jgi:hypothetical protein
MSRIYCTKKLQSFIGQVDEKLPSDLNEISINDWNAHLFFLDKRKCLIFVNNLTFYTIFLVDILKKDLKNIDLIFRKRLQEQLVHDKIISDSEFAESIFSKPELNFFKTNNNKKVIGRINDFTDMFKVHCFYKYDNVKEMDVLKENGLMNQTTTGKLNEIKKSWSSPIQNLEEIIKTSA